MDRFDVLIVVLMAIHGKAKDIHYNCPGDAFYGKHLFADRIADGIDEFIDQIKETCILGKGRKPMSASKYFKEAATLLDSLGDTDDFRTLLSFIIDCLQHIERFDNVSRGDSKLLDDIANKLQNDKGLLHIMFGDHS